MISFHHIASALVVGAVLVTAATSQVTNRPVTNRAVIDRVIPEAAAPGDLIIIEGRNLRDVKSVDFYAIPGGFVGTWTETAIPVTVTQTRLTVLLPDIGAAFAPPNAIPPGNPYGTVTVVTPTLRSNAAPFFYMEGTFIEVAAGVWETPQTTTLGTGTTQSTGQGKPVATFDLSGGPPASGNPDFVLEIENAVSGAPAVAVLGFPLVPPFPIYRDGTYVLDPAYPHHAFPGMFADGKGNAFLPFPIPGLDLLDVTLCFQWVLLDGDFTAISNGLSFRL